MAYARGYLGVRFDAVKFKRDMKQEYDTIWKGIKNDYQLYKQLLEILGQELTPFVPWETGELGNFSTDSKNGLLYKKLDKNGFNIAEYQYTHPLDHFAKDYFYPASRVTRNGTMPYKPNGRLIAGKEETIHERAKDHWADKETQAIIWPDFTVRAKPLIIKSANKKRGKK
jgi:hypothetical protein